MTLIDVRADLKYEVRIATVFLFQIAAARTDHQQVIWEQLTMEPNLSVETYQVGLEGNQLHRILVQPCELQVSYQGNVELAPEIHRSAFVGESNASEMPAEVLTYLNPSRYCESDLLARFSFEEFGQMPRGFSRVQAICDWVSEHLDYTSGSTNSSTTAADVLLQRTGVCRDYAHLAITLCRGVGIPARYVAGYAVGLQPPDFHGFMEAFLGGQWYLFDPTKMVPVSGLVRIGVGRDAADVSFATLTGDALLIEKTVWANDSDNAGPPASAGGEPPAVSLA
ncbi:transglutaminase-like domain-containing protein [Novipirellula artificiosorum]|uniref:Transglutaminase-like superfamily protein n=1 Tax=Novipirellula artificiosorum TaxID=2528016 RepID=A0A5C6DTF9_9BACT|nr:transglutaminase family protein [Novipirellula artificiosorum]TWU40603.1 Transglutaminase-like superfamily protein [Novipirellula artificiosorum]